MKSETGSAKLIFSLAFTALISGVLLAMVYAGTLPQIQRNQAEAVERAILKILPGTTHFETYEIVDNHMVLFEAKDGSLPEGEAIYRGFSDQDEFTGFAVPSKGPGFQDDIKLIYGFKPKDELIVGMQVLESRETPGLGDKINKKASFLDCFLELKVKPLVEPNKKGKRSKLNQVDTISGATISSVSVIKIINKSIERYEPIIQAFQKDQSSSEDTP